MQLAIEQSDVDWTRVVRPNPIGDDYLLEVGPILSDYRYQYRPEDPAPGSVTWLGDRVMLIEPEHPQSREIQPISPTHPDAQRVMDLAADMLLSAWPELYRDLSAFLRSVHLFHRIDEDWADYATGCSCGPIDTRVRMDV